MKTIQLSDPVSIQSLKMKYGIDGENIQTG